MTGVRGFCEGVYTVPKSTLKYEKFITIEQTSGCMFLCDKLGAQFWSARLRVAKGYQKIE